MSQNFPDIKKIGTGLVEMGSECVPERMAGHSVRESQSSFVIFDPFVDPAGIERFGGSRVLNKEPAVLWFDGAGMPVGVEIFKGSSGKNGIPVGAVLGRRDIEAQILPVDVFSTDMAEFTGTDAGGIEHGTDSEEFGIPDGGNERFHFLHGRDIRKVLKIFPIGDLIWIPWAFENVKVEGSQLCNDAVHGTVFDLSGLLNFGQEIPDIVPGHGFGRDQNPFAVIEIRDKIRDIGFDGMFGKIPEHEHPDEPGEIGFPVQGKDSGFHG